MADTVDWTPLQPFGARVDLDLRGSVSEAQIAELRRLYDVHHLLFFPEQALSGADQARATGWFGPVRADKPVSNYNTDGDMGALGDGELVFHSDLSCTPEPVLGISLHALELGEGASPTRFVDAVAAARNLPEALRARIEGLHVMNLWPLKLDERQRRETAPPDWPGTAHPLLKAHPRTGEPILYLNASHSDRIVELAAGASDSLIEELFAQLYDPANLYEHQWRVGDYVVWDNLALQHARPAVPPGVARTLQRVEIGVADYMKLMPPALIAAYAQQ